MLEGDIGSWLSWTVHYEHVGVINPSSETRAGLFSPATARPTALPCFPLTGRPGTTAVLCGGMPWTAPTCSCACLRPISLSAVRPCRGGWGRVWTPADLFAAFSPVAIDQEFKPGIDAFRAKVSLGQFSQLDAVYAAFGESLRHHAMAVARPDQPARFRPRSDGRQVFSRPCGRSLL